jgi:juvenile hormone acid methyltransferase
VTLTPLEQSNFKAATMNNANLYKKSNVLQKRDAKEIIEEFSSLFNWRWDGSDSDALMDVGCGAADVLSELILPKIPINTKVVGIDISKEMIKYANEHYGNEYLKFYKVDIESEFMDGKTTPFKPDSFNFITSFYALHWIQNQR